VFLKNNIIIVNGAAKVVGLLGLQWVDMSIQGCLKNIVLHIWLIARFGLNLPTRDHHFIYIFLWMITILAAGYIK
jgi:hypothetical protein